MRFDLLQSISLGGDAARANDDRMGAGDALAWMIDGATDLGPAGLIGGRGGAAWIAMEASAGFAAAGDAALDLICKGVFARVARRFDAIRARPPVAGWELPRAALLVAALGDAALECAWAGDCSGLLLRGDTVQSIGTPAGAKAREQAHAASLAEHGLGTRERPPAILDSLKRAREASDRPALGTDPAMAGRLDRATLPCAPGDRLLLMSDGFAAIADDYGLYSHADLMAAAVAPGGLAMLAAALRAAEVDDAACTRWPRFKASDDASALLLAIA